MIVPSQARLELSINLSVHGNVSALMHDDSGISKHCSKRDARQESQGSKWKLLKVLYSVRAYSLFDDL